MKKSIKSKEIAEEIYSLCFEETDYKNRKKNMLKLTRYIGKILSKVPIFKRKIKDGLHYYIMEKNNLLQVIKSKGFDKYLFEEEKGAQSIIELPDTTPKVIENPKESTKTRKTTQTPL